ncbi:MAG: ATP-binding protein [Sulfitobacter sp.]
MTFQHSYSDLNLVSAPVFVLKIDGAGEPVYAAVNDYALKKADRPLSDYLGRTALEVYPHAYGRTAYDHHCAVRDKGIPTSYQLDLPIAGITRRIQTTLCPDFGADGKVARLVGCSSDLTSEKNAEDAKVQFNTLTVEMEQFVAMAAHDLRAPMRQIAAISGLLREEMHDQNLGNIELLETLNRIAEKTMELVTEVLQHVEVTTTKNPESVFSFPALCHDICETLDPTKTHNITTSTTTLSADRTVMQIALRNMIENALKHGHRDRLDIKIDVRQGRPGMVEVTVTDNGKGFSSDALKVMNHSQFRAESGYGLFAVKRLISARGGTLVAQNLPIQTGAIVRFSLPGFCIDQHTKPGTLKRRRHTPNPVRKAGRRHSA